MATKRISTPLPEAPDPQAPGRRRAVAALAAIGLGAAVPLRAAGSPRPVLAQQVPLRRIAFGSCADEQRPQSFWYPILGQSPELFMMIGDNVYATVRDGQVLAEPNVTAMRDAYADLAAQTGYQALRSRVPMLATWDDHDYGVGDSGAENPIKHEAKAEFMDFFGVGDDHAMRARGGVYQSVTVGPEGQRVQLILLDTRWFRSPLKRTDTPMAPGRQRYLPDPDPGKTMLGAEQWAWLEQALRQPADVRIIASSIQVLARNHGWERWGNFPHEKARLVQLIADTDARGVVLISGDRHRGAVYRRDQDVPYPLYELTSSSLNASFRARQNEDDAQRLGPMFEEDNFGMVTIDWDHRIVHLGLHAVEDGRRVRGVSVAIKELAA
ncbi:MAG: alkaline phosphatase family protein [Gammaproteobacteria bacterium]|nr:alkaline phosphatase family protein [Gammaproteobacteria bacterium]